MNTSGHSPVKHGVSVHHAIRKSDTGKTADIINIKLMKGVGLEEALEICRLAEEANLKVMVGCMLEGAVSVLTAMHLAYAQPVVQYVDLDSPLLFKEMPAELKDVYAINKIHLQPFM